jgi:hypothetical protein
MSRATKMRSIITPVLQVLIDVREKELVQRHRKANVGQGLPEDTDDDEDKEDVKRQDGSD